MNEPACLNQPWHCQPVTKPMFYLSTEFEKSKANFIIQFAMPHSYKKYFTGNPCPVSKSPMSHNDRSRWSITESLYKHRHGAFPWFAMTLLGLVCGSSVLVFIVWRFDYATMMKIIQSPVWTVILAIIAAPLAYYVWLVRDRNALETRRQIKESELMKNFHQLQEWVTTETDEAKKVSAILQLHDYFRPATYLFPAEMAYFVEFSQRVGEYLLFLCKNRSLYDPHYSAFKSRVQAEQGQTGKPVVSPAAQAFAEVLLRDGSRLKNLSGLQADGMELAGLLFPGVVVERGSWIGTSLSGANFCEAKLSRSTFLRADMRGADLSSADLKEVDFEGATMLNAILTSSVLTDCRIVHTSLHVAQFQNAIGYRMRVRKSGLLSVNAEAARFIESHFQEVDFQGANLVGCQLDGSRFQDCTFVGANFSRSSLLGADFSCTSLSGASFDGAIYDTKTRFPEGFETIGMTRVDESE